MFLRTYLPTDKRALQKLFFETVHSVNAKDYSSEQLKIWAPDTPDREMWSRLDHQYCFVVEYQKNIVGFASLTKEGMVDLLFVHKDFQGKGIATNLMKQLERLARKKGVLVLVSAVSTTARSFFEKRGFVFLEEQQTVIQGLEFLQFRMQKTLPMPATYGAKT